MPNRGSLVVLLLLTVGLIVSAIAVWHHWQQTRRPLELWGAEGALLIERAPQVTLFRLQAADAAIAERGRTVRISNIDFVLADEIDMQGAAGFSHVRWGLCQDSSFDWESERIYDAAVDPRWDYALRFADGENQIMLVLNTNRALITQVGGSRCVSFEPIAQEAASVLMRQLPDASR